MKTTQQKSAAEKKPPISTSPQLSTAAGVSTGTGDVIKNRTFDSPSAAIWSKYIDSRMKQFETR